MRGTLYVVSMPIGNVEDITARALRILRSVHVVAAENPSSTRTVFDHYGIETPLTSYHNLNKEEKAAVLLRLLEEGQELAVVSDAGTPVISDPGCYLISSALDAGIRVVPVPGPSAVLAALAVSGMAGDAFVFQGYLPKQRQRRQCVLQAMRSDPRTHILFLSAARLASTLSELAHWLGNRRMVLAHDLTKTQEQVIAGTVKEIEDWDGLDGRTGELTLVIQGAQRHAQAQKRKPSKAIKRRRASVSARGRRARGVPREG